jgi:hypothetical protein
VPLDYAAINARRRSQKSALTRAVNSGDSERVIAVCRSTRDQWNQDGAWPDDWSRWQRALDDILPWNEQVRLEDL